MKCTTPKEKHALRGPRPLREMYTGFARSSRWSAQNIIRDHRERHPKGYTNHEVIAPRVVGPSGRINQA
jgi:hypothetical protein